VKEPKRESLLLAVGSQNVFSIYAARLPAASEMIMEIAGDEDDLEKVITAVGWPT
jgi:hypothetical protein